MLDAASSIYQLQTAGREEGNKAYICGNLLKSVKGHGLVSSISMSHSPSESLCSSALRTGVDMLTGDASGWVFSLGGEDAMADATIMCQLRCV